MSFFNFGPSPTKSSDASNSGDSNGYFNMFGGGAAGAVPFFGRGPAEPVDSSAGSFFSGGPGTGEAGGSMFGSAESGTRQQQENANYGHAKHGLPEDISQPPPVKKIRTEDPSQSQPMSSTAPAKTTTPWGAPPDNNALYAAHTGPSPTTSWGPPSVPSTVGPSPTSPWVDSPVTKPDTGSYQEVAQSQNHHQGRPNYEAPSMPNQTPPAKSNHRESHNYYKVHEQAPPQGNSSALLDSSAHSSALRGQKTDDFKKGEDDEIPADILLRDMIDMQKQQLSQLIPQMKKGEEISDQVLNSARLVLRDVTNYGEKLAVTKKLYCSRLSQVSSYLRMIPKTEK